MKKSSLPFTKKNESKKKTMSEFAEEVKGQGCSAEVYAYFTDSDDFNRHQLNSSTIGHALIHKNDSGELEAVQYAINQDPKAKSAVVRELTEIYQVVNNRNAWFRAKDSSGNKYISRRSLTIDTVEGTSELRYFSPYEYDSSEADEFSDNESLALFRDDLTTEAHNALASIPRVTKSTVVEVDASSVRQRDENSARDTTQNEIMGQSARDAYEDFFNRMKDYLSPRLILILKRAYEARIFSAPENEFRPEWLHKIAHSLMPISERPEHNPQQKSNLAAAAKWANTEMMLSERIAKWFKVSKEDAKVTVASFFEMLLDSQLIETIHFQVTVEIDQRFIRFIQDIDVLKEYPLFRKTSDLAQAIALSETIFQNKPPISKLKVGVIHGKKDGALNPLASMAMKHAALTQYTTEKSEDEINAYNLLSTHPDFMVCKPVQDVFPPFYSTEPYSIATIVDLETTGLDPAVNEIIEIAMVSFAYTKTQGILGIVGTYTSLNEPKLPVSLEVAQITGITNEQLVGQAVDWSIVRDWVARSKYIICHNAKFDGAFLAQQTPECVQSEVRTTPFACTLDDINWFARGYDPRKLDYLNFKLGYFYNAHRALNDCWATLNLLVNIPGTFDELFYNAHKKRVYFFSNPLIGHRSDNPLLEEAATIFQSHTTQEEVHRAYEVLSVLPQYKIYRAVPQPSPVSKDAVSSVITMVDLKTSGSNYLTDEITAIAMVSFIRVGGEFKVTDCFASYATANKAIEWDPIANILFRTQYLISHNSDINRKFLECRTPAEIQCKVRALPFASTHQDINWKNRKISNTSLKYLAFLSGFFFQPDCLVSRVYAALNLLEVVPGAWDELIASFSRKQNIILLVGPFCYGIRDELKQKGFQWSTGAGGMGKGWWACIDEEKRTEVLSWLMDVKNQAVGKNDIYIKLITALDRYSTRAEFKAAHMRALTNDKPLSIKRPAEEQISKSYPRPGSGY